VTGEGFLWAAVCTRGHAALRSTQYVVPSTSALDPRGITWSPESESKKRQTRSRLPSSRQDTRYKELPPSEYKIQEARRYKIYKIQAASRNFRIQDTSRQPPAAAGFSGALCRAPPPPCAACCVVVAVAAAAAVAVAAWQKTEVAMYYVVRQSP
jgi:hypothetical protein